MADKKAVFKAYREFGMIKAGRIALVPFAFCFDIADISGRAYFDKPGFEWR